MPRWCPTFLPLALAFGAAIPIALARCSYDSECDRTTAAIYLPAAGDSVALTGIACFEGEFDEYDWPGISVVVDGGSEFDDGPPIVLRVIDPATGIDVSDGKQYASLAHDELLCDSGFEIEIESAAPPGQSLTAVLWLTAEVEHYDLCDVRLEAP